jgi:hypothetical protein
VVACTRWWGPSIGELQLSALLQFPCGRHRFSSFLAGVFTQTPSYSTYSSSHNSLACPQVLECIAMGPQASQTPSVSPSTAKLRTKKGCLKCWFIMNHVIPLLANVLLTGRARRKKCDERKPRCSACSRLHFQCIWTQLNESNDDVHSSHEFSVNLTWSSGLPCQPVRGALIQGAVSAFISQWIGSNLESSWTGFDCAAVLYPTASMSLAFSNALEAISLLTVSLSDTRHVLDIKQSAVQSYGRALRAINSALCAPKQLAIDHTLGAIELICLFEVLHQFHQSSFAEQPRPSLNSLPQRQTYYTDI